MMAEVLRAGSIAKRAVFAVRSGGVGADGVAREYAEACRRVNARLDRIEAMLGSGDELQAIQEAECVPAILDEVAALTHWDLRDWGKLCGGRGLPAVEAINEGAVRRLNDLYARGVSVNHPLYKEYRSALAKRDDFGALRTLQVICRMNPSDANASSEIERLERKVLERELDQLGEALRVGVRADALARVQRIIGLGLRAQPSGVAWAEGLRLYRDDLARAALAGCRESIGKLRGLMDDGEVATVGDLLEDVDAAGREHGLSFDEGELATLKGARAWFQKRREEEVRRERFSQVCKAAWLEIDGAENDLAADRLRELVVARERRGALSRRWLEISRFGLPVPPDLEKRFRDVSGLLSRRIAKREARFRLAVLAGAAASLAVLLSGAVMIYLGVKANEISKDLDAFFREGKAEAAGRLVGAVKEKRPYLVRNQRLAARMEEIETWVKGERSKVAAVELKLGDVERDVSGPIDVASIDRVNQVLDVAARDMAGIASDMKAQPEARLLGLRHRWESGLLQKQQELVAVCRPKVQGLLERAPKEMQYTVEPGIVRQFMAEFTELEGEIVLLQKTQVGDVLPDERVVGEFRLLAERAVEFGRELDAIDGFVIEATKAQSIDDYLNALRSVAGSRFVEFEETRLAQLALGRKEDLQDFARALVAPHVSAGTWGIFRKDPDRKWRPGEVAPQEEGIFLSLRDDENLSAIETAYVSSADRGTFECWVRGGIAGGTAEIAPKSARSDTVEFKPFPIAGSVRARPTPEKEAFGTAGVRLLLQYAEGRGSFSETLLPTLDTLRGRRDLDSLFKAYVQVRLDELVSLRPEDWGVDWVPAYQADMRRLRAIVANLDPPLGSSDWLLHRESKRKRSVVGELSDFYRSGEGVSYARQQAFGVRLARLALAGGVRFAGFVDVGGKPHIISLANTAKEAWGFGIDGAAHLLYVKADESGGWKNVAAAMPFTPLYRSGVKRAEERERAIRRFGGDENTNWISGCVGPFFVEGL